LLLLLSATRNEATIIDPHAFKLANTGTCVSVCVFVGGKGT